jgi:serine/threonine protein kinase
MLPQYKKHASTIGLGTIFYMSPEVYEGKIHSFETDVWALGIILYFMITKEYPFEGNTEYIYGTNVVTKPHKHVV